MKLSQLRKRKAQAKNQSAKKAVSTQKPQVTKTALNLAVKPLLTIEGISELFHSDYNSLVTYFEGWSVDELKAQYEAIERSYSVGSIIMEFIKPLLAKGEFYPKY